MNATLVARLLSDKRGALLRERGIMPPHVPSSAFDTLPDHILSIMVESVESVLGEWCEQVSLALLAADAVIDDWMLACPELADDNDTAARARIKAALALPLFDATTGTSQAQGRVLLDTREND